MDRLTAADDDSYVALRHRPSRVVVVLTAGDPGDRPRPARSTTSPSPSPTVPTLEAWAAELTAQGIDHPGVVDELGKPSLVLADPDGNSHRTGRPTRHGLRSGHRSATRPGLVAVAPAPVWSSGWAD